MGLCQAVLGNGSRGGQEEVRLPSLAMQKRLRALFLCLLRNDTGHALRPSGFANGVTAVTQRPPTSDDCVTILLTAYPVYLKFKNRSI